MKIPTEVKEQAWQIIKEYNETFYAKKNVEYFAEFRGKNLYLNRIEESGDISPMARLTYTGKMDDWDFAIFRWTTEKYDPDEDYFPGCQHVDGTVRGAMLACDEAYPLSG